MFNENPVIIAPKSHRVHFGRCRITLCINERTFTIEIESADVIYNIDNVIEYIEFSPIRSMDEIEVISLVSSWRLGYHRRFDRKRYIYTNALHDIDIVGVIPR